MEKTLKEICQKYDATKLQQLYKVITGVDGNLENKDVFPVSIVQAIFDGPTGVRLDNILALCNNIYIPYAGTAEATRLKVAINMRRKGLIITYRDYNNRTWTQRYKHNDTVNDDAWANDDNWEAWNFDTLLKDVTDIIVSILSNINDYPEFQQQLIENITPIVQELIGGGAFNEIINDTLMEIVPNYIQESLNNYFASDEGKQLVKEICTGIFEEAIGDYLANLRQVIQDNERVTANALARHEQAILDIQTHLGIQ